MRKELFKDQYRLVLAECGKGESGFPSIDAVVDFFRARIEAHPVAVFIAVFDHAAHTRSLGEKGSIAPEIINARHVVFCFGKELESPLVMGVRPRSIGITELDDRFVISFQEAPKPAAQEAMEAWAAAFKQGGAAAA